MLVGKETITFGIKQLTMFYIDFDRFVDKKGLDLLVDTWYNIFQKIEFNYVLAEQDFKQAIFNLITNSNKTPTFSDILDGMRDLIEQHEKEELEKKIKSHRE